MFFQGLKAHFTSICAEATFIPFDSIRIYAYELPQGETPICDRNIIDETKWYRATEDMVTNATTSGICGTTFPMWLQGELKKTPLTPCLLLA